MGIAAVPGSGKTYVLSALAARLLSEGRLERDQEVLVVTLVNSAVENFTARISGFMQSRGMLPQLGYRVRTLHGLAHDIVRQKPAAAGLEARFGIIDEREADFIRREAALAWLRANPGGLDQWLDPEIEGEKREWVVRQALPESLYSFALAFLRSAKDRRLTPEVLHRRVHDLPSRLPLVEMGLAMYADYQRALTYRGAVDFDDLIRLALDLLESDPDFLERLRYRFPYILEDEAQDSSRLQEHILRLLAGPGGNWVRVGDPNQAIFETFTTANPRYLRQFIETQAEHQRELPASGRSQPGVIAVANRLIDWVMVEHPEEEVRSALAPPHILATGEQDPKPNPPNDPDGIRFITRKFSPEEEIQAVIDSLERWLPENAERTVAVLVPRNARGVEVIEALKRRRLPFVEFLSSTAGTRAAAGSLANLLAYLADPGSATKLAKAYQVWRRDWREGFRRGAPETEAEDSQGKEMVAARTALLGRATSALRKLRRVEEYLAPRDPLAVQVEGQPGGREGPKDAGWLASLAGSQPSEVLAELRSFRDHARRWIQAVALPIDQLVLTLAREVFSSPVDLALAYKLALLLHQSSAEHPEWRLPELANELATIARNERRFIGFSADDTGFDPGQHRGVVVVTTMHKAKGLEWDRVYLMSVNNYDFPALQAEDRYIAEKWFLRDGLNLEAEALRQLETALDPDEYGWYEAGQATRAARADYVRERLRLLFVGITRAKRELVVTWNSGRHGDLHPALAFQALSGWWQAHD